MSIESIHKHGKPLSSSDKVFCVLKADRFGISREETAHALGVTAQELGDFMQKHAKLIPEAEKAIKPL